MQPGPSRLVEMAYIAREFYVNDVPLVQIAEHLGVSRFKVARMLGEARDLGIVRIIVRSPEGVTVEGLEEIAARYGLREARCAIPQDRTAAGVREALGRLASDYLSEAVSPADVLGFASGRTLSAIADHLPPLPPCDAVQLTGLAGPLDETAGDLLRRVTSRSGGRAFPIHAPLVASDPAAAEAFRRQPATAEAFDRMRGVTKAIMAVGSWDPVASQLAEALAAEEREALVTAGVRAEVSTVLFDERGRVVPGLEDRSIAISLDTLRAIPEVVLVAGGREKLDALRAVLRAGIATVLITDDDTAHRLLER
ncbi:transcriptional regulator [Leucobacter sp. CSA1]|uniref:Transcriptional regulator n=1 Tax=Leucobacter chromiisoli TaxID=2796471 RepID=A0A934Q4T9_9MICO|nr:sugar-binding domain-containing protein [Leucobacter chromiisoli]MBK0417445.1 transcriptional regulator [Leucobacter chromiisoli]